MGAAGVARVHRESERIGIDILTGVEIEEIVHLFAFAMKHGLGAKDLAETVYAYPTFASDIKNMV